MKNINIGERKYYFCCCCYYYYFQCYLDATWISQVSTNEWVNVGKENRKQIKKTLTTFNDYDAIFVAEAIRWQYYAILFMWDEALTEDCWDKLSAVGYPRRPTDFSTNFFIFILNLFVSDCLYWLFVIFKWILFYNLNFQDFI